MAKAQTQPQDSPAEVATARTDRDLLQEILDAQRPLIPTKLSMETIEGFEAIQRAARLLSASSLVPDIYKGNLPNCTIAMNMASRLGADPLMVMQNLYIVHGRPGWSSQFYIAAFNSCGRFTPIHYRYTGETGKDSWGCIAWAKEKATGEIVEGPEVTIAIAKAEEWYSRKGSKWQTMPQLMLDYRSASFLVRTVAPELTMGLKTVEEIRDGDAGDDEVATTPSVVVPAPAPGATKTDQIKAKLSRAKPQTIETAPEQPLWDSTTANQPIPNRGARIVSIREALDAKVGKERATALWPQVCDEAAGGRPSLNWTEQDIAAVSEYVRDWKVLPVEDYADANAEREPGSDDE
jgi:hypothetical protein